MDLTNALIARDAAMKAYGEMKSNEAFLDNLTEELKKRVDRDGHLALTQDETELLFKNLKTIRCMNHGAFNWLDISLEKLNDSYKDMWEKYLASE